jgi:nucleotide-binding universal stress UspA family protein
VIGERPDASADLRADHAGMRRILIATDGSQPAAEAVAVAIDLATQQGAPVTLVHVVSAPAALPFAEVEAALAAALELAVKSGVEAEIVVTAGDPADEIVAYADTIDAGLIVVGSRGRGAGDGLLLGSVANAILREARRPVLVARAATVQAEVSSAQA